MSVTLRLSVSSAESSRDGHGMSCPKSIHHTLLSAVKVIVEFCLGIVFYAAPGPGTSSFP